MPRVFMIHEPVRWDRRLQEMVRFKDLELLHEHGDLHLVIPGLDRPPPLAKALPALQEAFKTFAQGDFIAMVGEPDLWVMGSVLALQNTGGYCAFLRWNNRAREYERSYVPEGLWTSRKETK
jgi:hypothetical protein